MAEWYNLRIPPWIGWPGILLISYLFLYWLANRAVYFPIRYPQGYWREQNLVHAVDVWLTTHDQVNIHGWFSNAPDSRIATLFLHGNAGNVTHRIPHIAQVTRAGSSILVIDYRGYGRSDGSPTEHGLYRDADAAYDWLITQGYTPDRLVIHGESLGTAVAVDLASRRPCAGLILEAPFSSASAVAGSVLPYLGPALIRVYNTKSKIAKVRVPLLVIHGTRDSVIPFRLGRDLFEAADQPKEFWAVEGADHNDLLHIAAPDYVSKLRALYSRLLP